MSISPEPTPAPTTAECPGTMTANPASPVPLAMSPTALSIANFKPTPKEVLSGIAPHLFEENPRVRRRNSRRHTISVGSWQQQQHYRPRPPAHLRRASDLKASVSPLGMSAVISSWDENGVFMGQTERQMDGEETVDIIRVPTRINNGRTSSAESENRSLTQISKFPPTATTGENAGSAQRKRSRSFRLDVQIAFKTIVIMLRPSSKSTS